MKKQKTRLLIVSRKEPFYLVRAINRQKYDIYVLGVGNQRVALSRYCSGFTSCKEEDLVNPKAKIKRGINNACKEWGIDFIIPLDSVSTFCVAKLIDSIETPIFPSVKLNKLLLLNNKWKFSKLLKKSKISHPKTLLIKSAREFERIKMAKPFILKPVSMDGGVGVVKITSEKDLFEYKKLNFPYPLIAQEFIQGTDIDLSLFAKEGKIIAWTAQKWDAKGILKFIRNNKMAQIGKSIVRQINYTGAAHFDMRMDKKTGKIYVIECNPRLWGSINASILSGIDFVQIGLEGTGRISIGNQKNLSYELPSLIVKKSLTNPFYLFEASHVSQKDFLLIVRDPLPYTIIAFEVLFNTGLKKSILLGQKLSFAFASSLNFLRLTSSYQN